ncbi:hypothetical protein DOTSEDRAFT_71890 [Dothistroma septosporum NZE10]|uniref:Uncharacterized protein n=1 Tax=Dothistroma septosporum (strain NZE10 / CBS 128990) TaxID=675120 RepID=N1PL40_DOTSN|nr:hypothetical protein DOTSEDRAFT_71890 [Dothistroma septosporum NZE10]
MYGELSTKSCVAPFLKSVAASSFPACPGRCLENTVSKQEFGVWLIVASVSLRCAFMVEDCLTACVKSQALVRRSRSLEHYKQTVVSSRHGAVSVWLQAVPGVHGRPHAVGSSQRKSTIMHYCIVYRLTDSFRGKHWLSLQRPGLFVSMC